MCSNDGMRRKADFSEIIACNWNCMHCHCGVHATMKYNVMVYKMLWIYLSRLESCHLAQRETCSTSQHYIQCIAYLFYFYTCTSGHALCNFLHLHVDTIFYVLTGKTSLFCRILLKMQSNLY